MDAQFTHSIALLSVSLLNGIILYKINRMHNDIETLLKMALMYMTDSNPYNKSNL